MPFLFRQIKKSRWYNSDAQSFLQNDDIPADPLGDLQTKNNELSIWFVDDTKSNLEQIATALAAKRDAVANVDYALLDFQYIKELGFKIKNSKGGTPDKDINEFHKDIIELSGVKLVSLAKVFFQYAKIERIPEKKIIGFIKIAIETERIPRSEVKPAILGKL